MNTYFALLRGINVGGRNLLPMKDFRTLLEGRGLTGVKTYIQSGNAVFQSDVMDLASLSQEIESAIQKQFGFSPPVFLLDLPRIEKALASNPFDEATSEPSTLHLFFLASKPELPDLASLESCKVDSERFELIGDVLYLHAPDGMARSRVASRLEKALGVSVTARNWRTVSRLIEMV